jgi:putative DNA primase/helicase
MTDEPRSIFHPDFPDLLPHHVEQLRRSGIADEVIRERHYESVLGRQRLLDLGFAEYQARKPGLLLPIYAPDGSNGLYQYKPDLSRTDRSGKVFKYETPARAGLRVDVPARCRPMLDNPSIPLYITEGIKKGDAGATHGLCLADVMGVWGFRGRNDLGGISWLADWQSIALNERVVNIVYDSDVMTKDSAKRALDMLTEMLRRRGSNVRHIFLPGGPGGEKVGLDDFLLTHPVADLDRWTVTPTLAPEPKAPSIFYKLAPGDERHLTDTGNAYRLVACHGAELRFCHAWGKWLTFTGKRWEVDQRGLVVTWAKDAVRSMYREAAATSDTDQATALVKWAVDSESVGKLEAMMTLAKNEIPISPDELDLDPWLFNTVTGTIDLRTGEMNPHDPSDFITKISPVPYDEDARCDTWEAFLNTIIPDESLLTFLQNAIGYSLTGDVSEQVLFFLYGLGANGKSTFLNAILGILSTFAKQAAPGLLMVKKGESHPTEIADLAGVRFLTTVEVTEGKELAETLVKQITGGDPIRARRMREDFWTFMPSHKIWLAANHKPVIKGTDYAIWRRVRLIPFDVVIPVEKRDPMLGEKLKIEYPGILAWAVRGCLTWQRKGLGVPEIVVRATDSYQKEMDVLAGFLADCCVIDVNAHVSKGALYKEYRSWCESNGEHYETQRSLSGRIIERGFDEFRATGGVRSWIGIGLAVKRDSSDVNDTSPVSP